MSAMEIDEGLHSRQLAVYGEETMKRMSSHNVLISGLNGLGAEVAKNIILANFKGVTLHDTQLVTYSDLSSQFSLKESDIGKNRAVACAAQLQELNPTVSVKVETGELTQLLITSHQTVVLLDTYATERSLSELKLSEINDWCRSVQPTVNFITADVAGVFGRCFCDFGPNFTVTDVDGEQPLSAIVSGIAVSEQDGKKVLVVACVDENRIEFADNDYVTFSEVHGLDGLNSSAPLPVTVKSPYSFTVPFPDNVNPESVYISGGIVNQVKMSKQLEFKSFRDMLAQPGVFLESDFSKFGRSSLLHILFRSLDAYRQANAGLPEIANDEHAKTLLSLCKHINSTEMGEGAKLSEEEINNETTWKVVEALSRTCRGTVNPMCAIFGGIVGQEITKAASGKFHPLHQWLYMDFIEALPSPLPTSEQCASQGSRYDGQVAVFGNEVQEKIGRSKFFLVGAGALGCELLKNFALMGLSTRGGSIVLTDDDTIERSNLSRQFLFRNWHVGESKSKTAAEVIKTMNPEVNITAMQDRVSPVTENIFNDTFWLNLDGVCNALDNVKARLYVDQRCVFFCKPLLESGTLGTKCNTQVVVPHLTENYGASADPPEKEAPDCTLHNFPHNINHCLSWARSEFVGNFESAPAELRMFLSQGAGPYSDSLTGPGSVPMDAVQKISNVLNSLKSRPTSFEECVAWARLKFEDYFSYRIRQLIHNFPRDAATSSGLPFWSPPKRFPTPLTFSTEDKVHMQFLVAASVLRAKNFSVPIPEDLSHDSLKAIVSNVIVPDFVPQGDVKIETDPQAKSRGGVASSEDDAASQLPDLISQLSSTNTTLVAEEVKPDEFEKDNDANFHMDFISAVGNLRGRCYEIGEISKFHAKLIAGRIIPAIATTTAMATGFVCLELLKLLQSKKLEDYRNTFANLALPLFAMSEPMPPKKVTSRKVKVVPDPINHPEYEEEQEIIAVPNGHTAWDKLEFHNTQELTLTQFIELAREQHGITVGSIAVQSTEGKGVMVYNPLMPKTKANVQLKISEILTRFVGVDPNSLSYFVPAVLFENDDGENVETPEVVMWLRS
eukprot:c1792_g1_i1.p1 GENE.c1792_g1_i1~~c1792_g1_i1.p1  ORF type:complete len:1079 (-),score=297.63 c1792_g1_i1:122-3325(-)